MPFIIDSCLREILVYDSYMSHNYDWLYFYLYVIKYSYLHHFSIYLMFVAWRPNVTLNATLFEIQIYLYTIVIINKNTT